MRRFWGGMCLLKKRVVLGKMHCDQATVCAHIPFGD